MKKILFLFLLLVVTHPPIGLSFAKKPPVPQDTVEAVSGKKYACSMGCYFSEKPGKCPKCGMDLMEIAE